MARYFQLFDKETGEIQTLQSVDEAFCQNFNTPISEEYYQKWYSTHGFLIACGNDLHGDTITEELRKWSHSVSNGKFEQEEFDANVAILNWLRSKYTSTGFYSR